METLAAALNYAIPIFVFLILFEMGYSYIKGNYTFNEMDTISSLSSGITNITKDILDLSIKIITYTWLYNKIHIFDIQEGLIATSLAFISKDFAGYWFHRMEHRVNYFWNRHVIHHSSEEYNLACALRQSVSEFFSYGAILLVPMALLGVPPKIYAIVAPIHLFAQFWYHTKHIDKMGFLEKFLVTPSHHRVHHAINPEYIDKNFSQIFIIWDKLFGTFQPELKEVPAVYGIKKAPQTWNPILINFQHLGRLIQDATRTKSWWDKLRIWFMPTGWRPADVSEKYPIEITENPYSQVKYNPPASPWLKVWSLVQLLVTLFLALFLFNQLGTIDFRLAILYGGFIFLAVYAYTSLMDRKPSALWLEIMKSAVGVGFVFLLGDWFNMNQYSAVGTPLIISYLLISVIIVYGFVRYEIGEMKLSF